MAKSDDTGAVDERILGAAGKLFRERGFEATTVREIAAAASMLPGSLHYRYASKDDVLVALMARGVKRAIAAVAQAVKVTDDPLERLRLGLIAHVSLLLGGDDSLHVLLYDWRSLPAATGRGVKRERAKYESFWDGLLAEAYGSGRARPVLDLELVRQFGFGALNWTATWFDPSDGRTPEAIADTFFHFLAFGLLREGARPKNVDAQFEALVTPGAKR